MKNVPDTEAKIKLTNDSTNIETQGIKFVMNPYDEYAVEEALKIKEKFAGDSTVTVICLGPDRVVETLRTALAMGADNAVHVSDPAFAGGDALANAKVLAKVVQPMGFDLILGGKQGIDFDSAQTLGILAEYLGFPQVFIAVELEFAAEEGSIILTRRVEGGDEIVHVKLPAVISCEKGLNEPRYASLPGIMKAKKKEIKKITLADVGMQAEEVGAAGSYTKVVRYFLLPERPECKMLSGEPAVMAKELVRSLREDSKVI
ncbi:MAG: electron transfer flavoprotein subunit beta/FixA family protein [Candidatus Latescibacterota bacterium]